MKKFLPLCFLFLLVHPLAYAELTPDRDMEAIRMMQARADQARMEEEIKNPKKVTLDKGRAIQGDRSAPLQIVEYSDFQCPYCKQGYFTLEELRKKYGKKLVVMMKHVPLPFHPMAMPAALRFEAIALQSAKKAYQFYDEVFKNQDDMVRGGEAYLDELAKKLKVNVAKMKTDMTSDKVKAHLKSDADEAQALGITGTPGFNVAGVILKGAYPGQMFEQILDVRLKQLGGRNVSGK